MASILAYARGALDLLASLAMIAIAGVLLYAYFSRPRPDSGPQVPRGPLSLEGGAIAGSKSAPAMLLVFSDFECPYCARFANDVLPAIRKAYVDSGRLLVGFRDLPLERIHPHAKSAAVAARCAGRQGKFWDMHDKLFASPKQLKRADLATYAAAVGIDSTSFGTCMDDGEAARAVDLDIRQAQALQVTSTPTIFLGLRDSEGRIRPQEAIIGSPTTERLTAAIDRLLR